MQGSGTHLVYSLPPGPMGIRYHGFGCTKKGWGGVGALLGTIPPNMTIGSHTFIGMFGMYQE